MNDALFKKINYTFNDKKLCEAALTHRSFSDDNNERLEFLGDAIVNLVIAEALFEKYPHAQEGVLSRTRASLINRETLGNLGRQFELGHYLRLGPGELKSGGSERESIISCAMEAVIGAIYLDSGFEVVRQLILTWYEPFLNSLSRKGSHKDPKTQLQEWLQKKKSALPLYTVIATEGEAHDQSFTVKALLPDSGYEAIGKGSSRRRAEQAAASTLLEMIKHDSK